MSFTKVAPAGIGTSPGTSILIGDSLLHSTGIDIGSNTGVGVTIRQHGDATFTGIVTAASFSGNITGKATELATNATGTNLTLSGNLGVGGVLTYEDVTNVDAVGVITAREGIKIPDDKKIIFGAGEDGFIKSDGANFTIEGGGGGTGTTYVRGRTLSLSANGGSGGFNGAVTIDKSGDERVQLKYGSGTKLVTTSSGITVTGTLTATTFSGSGASLTNLPAANLTGTLPAISGANLTNLPVPTTITVADESSDTTCNPLFVTTTTGNLAPKTGTNLVFNSSSGNLRTGSLFLGTGSNESKAQDGLIMERNSGDGIVHISAGRSGGNYGGFNFYVAGDTGGAGSNIKLRHQMVYDGSFRWYDSDGTTERLRIDSSGNLCVGITGGSAKLHTKGEQSGGLIKSDAPEGTTRFFVTGNDSNGCEVNLYDGGGAQRGILVAESGGMSIKGGGTPSELRFNTTVTGGSSARRFLIDEYGISQIERGSNGWSTLYHKTNNGGTRFHYRQVYTSASGANINLIRIRRHYWGGGHYKIKVRNTYYNGSYESHFWISGHAANGNTSAFSINHNNVNSGNSSWIQKTATSHSSPGNNYAGWIDVYANVAAYHYHDIIIEASGMPGYSQDINNIANDGYALHPV